MTCERRSGRRTVPACASVCGEQVRGFVLVCVCACERGEKLHVFAQFTPPPLRRFDARSAIRPEHLWPRHQEIAANPQDVRYRKRQKKTKEKRAITKGKKETVVE
jgi:hypothetical protein